jgi:hypothetical protein
VAERIAADRITGNIEKAQDRVRKAHEQKIAKLSAQLDKQLEEAARTERDKAAGIFLRQIVTEAGFRASTEAGNSSGPGDTVDITRLRNKDENGVTPWAQLFIKPISQEAFDFVRSPATNFVMDCFSFWGSPRPAEKGDVNTAQSAMADKLEELLKQYNITYMRVRDSQFLVQA